MSSSPNLTDIEAALLAACTITAGVGSYNLTIPAANISFDQREITALASSGLPALDIVFQGEATEDQPCYRRRCVATYLITAYGAVTSTGTQAEHARQRRQVSAWLRDDVKAAIYASATLHGVASSHVKKREYIDTGGVAAERDSRGGQATARMYMDVIYYEPTGLTPPTA